MDSNQLPVPIAKLIIRYTHNLLSECEHNELDKWLEESDANLEIFEELTGDLEGKVFSPDDLIIETDDLLDTWMIAGLIAREMQGIITADETRALQNWIGESDHNKVLHEALSNKAVLHHLVTWLRQKNTGQNVSGQN